ncbi:epoxide hydrolase family protein [Plantactinospora solaniradicis]|uniref:Epoxide hydrolase family protein n=1 Tax=Plantactinospora solaniradicis TaxID=1723736 RepID=A0ABW1K3K5_9ACTN
MSNTEIRPYRIDVPQVELDDLAARLRRTLWPDELPGTDGAYGMSNARVRALADYWLEEFDWRAFEARLNAYPQFVTEIDGETIHFLHVRSAREDAVPLLLTHGWPGSVVEFLDLIEPLTAPGDTDAPAFHLVVPSLPGYGFSGPTRSAGWNRNRIAGAWVELMHRLGYRRYGTAGNDAGSMIAPEMGRLDPDGVIGVHVTQLFSFPSGDPAEFEGFTPTDYAALEHLQWFYDNMFSFNALHSQQPQTLAFALADSPVGLLAWNAQLMGESLDPEFVVANVAIYWLTRTAGSAIRLYYEDAHTAPQVAPTGPTTAPTALAMFAGDFQSIRPLAERDHANIVSWHAYDPPRRQGGSRDAGGHYAAHEAPDLLVGDMRRFFASLR